MIACMPSQCVPFNDPDSNIEESLKVMIERCDLEKKNTTSSSLKPTDEECHSGHLNHFLRSTKFNVEQAMILWSEWVKWRHEKNIDKIRDEEVADEVSSGIASWRGFDKSGRPCLVITGRLFDPMERKGNVETFQKFLIRTVEEGIRIANEKEHPEVCVLYDRRGLEWKHLDPLLFRRIRPLIDDLKKYYGLRLGALYILHLNWLFSWAFSWLVKPLFSMTKIGDNFLAYQTPDELLDVFHEEELFLTSFP